MKWGHVGTFLKGSLLAAQFAAALVLACLPLGEIPCFAGPCGKLLCLCAAKMQASSPDGKAAPVPVTLKLREDPLSNSGDFTASAPFHLESCELRTLNVATLEIRREEKAESTSFAVITTAESLHTPPPKI